LPYPGSFGNKMDCFLSLSSGENLGLHLLLSDLGPRTMKSCISAAVMMLFALVLSIVHPLIAGAAETNGIAAFERHDYAAALRLLRPLAEQGDAKAQTDLGFMYHNGWGVQKDSREAAKWFRKAAERGDREAQGQLGTMYLSGDAVPQDTGEALNWYRKAATQGDASMQDELALMYLNGDGVPQDYEEASKWYRMAADQGDAVAQFGLGVMYREGQGVPQDSVRAHMWLNLSAAHYSTNEGYNDVYGDLRNTAAAYRDELATKMTTEQIAEAQRLAREWKPSLAGAPTRNSPF
jgi:TPR repeat protein